MKRVFVDGQEFKGNCFSKKKLEIGDYEACTFIQCNFMEVDLSDINFSECEFKDCNLSMSDLYNTLFV